MSARLEEKDLGHPRCGRARKLRAELGVNVSAVADAALQQAVGEARRRRWLEENADAFAAQAEWHARNGHPLADILASPGRTSWSP